MRFSFSTTDPEREKGVGGGGREETRDGRRGYEGEVRDHFKERSEKGRKAQEEKNKPNLE